MPASHLTPKDLANLKAKHPVAFALRKAGFIPLPRLWVRLEDILMIKELAAKYQSEIDSIRNPINNAHQDTQAQEDPRLSIDAAWAAYDKAQTLA